MAEAALSQTDTGYEPVRSVTFRQRTAPAAVAAGGSLTLWTPAAGKKPLLRTIAVTTNAATVLQVKIGGVVIADLDFAGAGCWSAYFGSPGWPGAANETVTVVTTNAATVGGTVAGKEE